MKYNHLNIPETWKEYFSKYPNGLSLLEALMQWVSQVDDMTDLLNNLSTYMDQFKLDFDIELQSTAGGILQGWLDSGVLGAIITAAMQTDINNLVQITKFVNVGMSHAEIQAVFDAIPINGTVSFVYSDSYVTILPWIIKPYTKVIGNGSTITTSVPTVVFKTAGALGVDYHYITIKDFIFKDIGLTYRSAYHIKLTNATLCLIENIRIYGEGLTKNDVAGVIFDLNGVTSMFLNTVRNCLFNGASIVMECSDSWIDNNIIWAYARSFGIWVKKGSQFITHNQIIGSSVHGGIYAHDALNNYNIELVRIMNNYFDGSYDEIDSGIGIKAQSMVHSFITDNDFWRQMDNGIVLNAGSGNLVTNNIFKNNNRRDAANADILLNGTVGNNISNNQFVREITHTNKGNCITGTGSENTIIMNKVGSQFPNTYLAPYFNINDSTNELMLHSRQQIQLYASVLQNQEASPYALLSINAGALKTIMTPFRGSIIGLGLRFANGKTAGTLTLSAYKNNTLIAECELVADGPNPQYVFSKTFPSGLYTFNENDFISIGYATTADFAPANDVAVSLVIES